MTSLREARDLLTRAVAQYSAARSMPSLETAILAMHTGLETAFRACLHGVDGLPFDVREALEKPGAVNFPNLVDLMAEHTSVLGAAPSISALLVSLNTTRRRIAHPLDKPSEREIVNDARRLAELVVIFWPRLFTGEKIPRMVPVTLGMVQESISVARSRVAPPSVPPMGAEKPRHGREVLAPLRSLWRGESRPSRWFLRLLGGLAVAILAGWVWNLAVTFARWALPVKRISVVLAIIGIGLAVLSGRLLWRVFRLLGMRRILIILGVLYLLIVSVQVLTTGGEQPLPREILAQMAEVASGAWKAVTGFGRSLVEAPSRFRFAYTGRRPPIDVPGVQASSTSLEGQIIEPLVYTTLEEPMPIGTPTAPYIPLPSAPGTSRGIEVGGYVRVRGTGGKTLWARSGPGAGHDIVTRFPEGARLLVLEGPMEADGYVWWKVRGEQGEGWSAGQWLIPVE